MSTVAPTHWGRLSLLLDELMDMPDLARAAHLAVLRTGDATLADELAGLLTACCSICS